MQPFYLAMNMAGTVSTGAYTAGVVDFLIEAMDAWTATRDEQFRQFGEDYDRWTIPPHEVRLAALTGASGGGMVASLVAAALSQPFVPVTSQASPSSSASNIIYSSWVEQIDARDLLGHTDLDASGGKVHSLLDSTVVHRIAHGALRIDSPLPKPRVWVKDGLKLVLSVTNLGGTPYAIEPQTQSDSARALNFADRQDFGICWDATSCSDDAILLNARGGPEWHTLASTAIATGAFPLVLASQALTRSGREYNLRQEIVPEVDPKCGDDGRCICNKTAPLPPSWDVSDDMEFRTVNVDGGLTNNSPFDFARRELAGLPPENPNGHNPRDPKLADRAVINIAPLDSVTPAKLPSMPQGDLWSVVTRLVNVLVNQSRIQGENLQLTSDPAVASRWLIAPTTDLGGTEPLAGALVGAFAGFISQRFRQHDYQLGRRNCQQFLRRYFGVPWDNVLLRQYKMTKATRSRLDQEFGLDSEYRASAGSPVRLCPLIPVMPSLQPEIRVTRDAIGRRELDQVVGMALDRVHRVALALLSHGARTPDFAFHAAWPYLKSRLGDYLTFRASADLARNGFLRNDPEPPGVNGDETILDEMKRLREEMASLRNLLG